MALSVSALAHKDQKRKVSALPYIIHPVSVALLMAEYTDNENILATGLLHDVLEDQPEAFDCAQLEAWFGKDIMDSVRAVTKDASIKNWRKRNEAYLNNLRSARDSWANIVCAADKIANLTDMLRDFKEMGNDFWNNFHAGASDQYWWYSSVLAYLQEEMPGHGLTLRLEALVDSFGRMLYDNDQKLLAKLW